MLKACPQDSGEHTGDRIGDQATAVISQDRHEVHFSANGRSAAGLISIAGQNGQRSTHANTVKRSQQAGSENGRNEREHSRYPGAYSEASSKMVELSNRSSLR